MTYSRKINQIKDGLQPAFQSFFEDLIAGGKSAGEIFTDLIGSVAKLLAQLAAKVLVRALFGGIFGDGGTVPNRAFGGAVPNYAQGGDVVGLGMAVAAAMQREGAGAVPIVASVGEEVLSTRNGDAQFYRSLKERGILSELKQQEIGNYASGGSVGLATNRARSSSSSRNGDLIINVPVTVEKGADMDGNRAAALGQLVQGVVKQTIIKERRSGGLLSDR